MLVIFIGFALMSVALIWISFSNSINICTVSENLSKLLPFFWNRKKTLLLRKTSGRQGISKIDYYKPQRRREYPISNQCYGHLIHNRRKNSRRNSCLCQMCQDPFNLVAPIDYRRPLASFSRKTNGCKERGGALTKRFSYDKQNFFNSNDISPRMKNRLKLQTSDDKAFKIVKMRMDCEDGNKNRKGEKLEEESIYSKFIKAQRASDQNLELNWESGGESEIIEFQNSMLYKPSSKEDSYKKKHARRLKKVRKKKRDKKTRGLTKKRKLKRSKHQLRRKRLMYSHELKPSLSIIKEAKEESEECSFNTSCMSISNEKIRV